MEPSAPLKSCAPRLIARRYTDEESRITFSSWSREALRSSRHCAPSRVLVCRGRGAPSNVSLSVAAPGDDRITFGLLRTLGWFGSQQGSVARHRALSNSGAPWLPWRRKIGPGFVRALGGFRHRARLAHCGRRGRLEVAAIRGHRAALRVIRTWWSSRTCRVDTLLIRAAV
jgi:hypothetical protein